MKKQVFHLSALALLCLIGSVSAQEKKETDTTRVILLSGTPLVNQPYEIAILSIY